MHTKAQKLYRNHTHSTRRVNPTHQHKKLGQQQFSLVDNRPETAQQKMLQSQADNAVIQRKIFVKDEFFSFQNLSDENGNPFLLGHTSNKKKKFQMEQNDIQLENVDDYDISLDKDSRTNVFRSLGYGRPMNVTTPGGENAQMLPFKSFLFNSETPFDITVFDEGGGRGTLYPAFYSSMISGLSKKLNKVDGKFNPIIDQMNTVRSKMLPIIYGEDFRTSGALKVFDDLFDEAVLEIKQLCRNHIKHNLDDNDTIRSIKDEIAKVTKDLPWAKGGGKNKFKKQVGNGDWDETLDRRDKKPIVTTGNWSGIQSPMRREEKDYLEEFRAQRDRERKREREQDNSKKKRSSSKTNRKRPRNRD